MFSLRLQADTRGSFCLTVMANTLGEPTMGEVAEFYRVLLRAKGAGGMQVARIPEEWAEAHGYPLPLKRLGFSKVAQMLHALPHIAHVVTSGSSCVVFPVEASRVGRCATQDHTCGDETRQHVRAWLKHAASRAGEEGLQASLIPSLWLRDFPDAEPLPVKLKQMGLGKLLKFLYSCSDIVRVLRPAAAGSSHASPTEVRVQLLAETSSAYESPPPLPPLPPPPAGDATPADALAARPRALGSADQTVNHDTQCVATGPTCGPAPGADNLGGPESRSADSLGRRFRANQTGGAGSGASEKARPGLASEAASLRPRSAAQVQQDPAVDHPREGPEKHADAEVPEESADGAPGIERPSSQLPLSEIEDMYGKGFRMLAKMGYRHHELASRTPIGVIAKLDKRGLHAAGEAMPSNGDAKRKERAETPGKDLAFVKQWLMRRLGSNPGEPLPLSRIPELWCEEFGGSIPVKSLGHKKLLTMMHAMSDMVDIVPVGVGATTLLVLPKMRAQTAQSGAHSTHIPISDASPIQALPGMQVDSPFAPDVVSHTPRAHGTLHVDNQGRGAEGAGGSDGQSNGTANGAAQTLMASFASPAYVQYAPYAQPGPDLFGHADAHAYCRSLLEPGQEFVHGVQPQGLRDEKPSDVSHGPPKRPRVAAGTLVCVCARARVRVRGFVCVRACVRACVRVCGC